MQLRRRLAAGLAAMALLLMVAVAGAQRAASVTVFAASDLGPAFKVIVPRFEQQTKVDVTLVLGSTGMLTQQIRNGAPADVFFAANETFVNMLIAEKLTIPGTTSLYARGQIVTVTLDSGTLRVDELKDLTSSSVRRVAIANPQHAPYGLAAKQALEAANLWNTLEPKLVYGENVQQAVQFVRSGSADAGIVARSVVNTDDLTWKSIDQRLHAPLDQVAVVLARTRDPDTAKGFIDFVNGAQGRSVMRQFGFLLPGESF
jgi:molybdate transport system substrate-binding protein